MSENKENLAPSEFDTHMTHIMPGGVRPYPVLCLKISGDTPQAPHPPHYTDIKLDDDMVLKRVKVAMSRVAGWAWAAGKIKPDGICVEIGVDYGDGIARWLTGKPAIVIGVDPWLSMEWDDWFNQAQKEMDARYAGVVKRYAGKPVSIVRSTSDEFFAKLDPGFRADWWFIDGDHREEPCYRDIANAIAFSNRGAWIMLDDIDCARWAKDIGAALDRIIRVYGDEVECVWRHSSPAVLRVR